MEEENTESQIKNIDNMSDAELNQLVEKLVGTTPVPDEKHNAFTFLTNIAITEDTSKVGYLKDEELGTPQLTVRGDKSLALIASDIMENKVIADFFKKEAENTLATSLSRDGFLAKLGVMQKREIADTTKKPKPNRGWFKPKNQPSEEE